MADASYRPLQRVVCTTLDTGETVLLDLHTRRYYSLNDTGSRIWALFEDGAPPAAIAVALASEWEVSEHDAEHHVHAFLKELADEGLIAVE